MFEANDATPIFRANTTGTQAPEHRTFAIKPSTDYWLAVAAKVGSAGLPETYSASLCGAAFTP